MAKIIKWIIYGKTLFRLKSCLLLIHMVMMRTRYLYFHRIRGRY